MSCTKLTRMDIPVRIVFMSTNIFSLRISTPRQAVSFRGAELRGSSPIWFSAAGTLAAIADHPSKLALPGVGDSARLHEFAKNKDSCGIFKFEVGKRFLMRLWAFFGLPSKILRRR